MYGVYNFATILFQVIINLRIVEAHFDAYDGLAGSIHGRAGSCIDVGQDLSSKSSINLIAQLLSTMTNRFIWVVLMAIANFGLFT